MKPVNRTLVIDVEALESGTVELAPEVGIFLPYLLCIFLLLLPLLLKHR